MYDQIKTYCIEKNVTLVAVSKTRTTQEIMDLYNKGQRIFGENRVQEMSAKYEDLPKDIEWHLIGQLQKNKIKYIAPFVNTIHSIVSLSLLTAVNEHAKKYSRVINVLLQFHIAQEDTKQGLSITEAHDLLAHPEIQTLNNINIIGVMGMATYTLDENQISREFKSLRSIYENLQQTFFHDKTDFCEVSMGMSGDYKIAINEGATIVRIGSAIF